jgi:hypothetical protein
MRTIPSTTGTFVLVSAVRRAAKTSLQGVVATVTDGCPREATDRMRARMVVANRMKLSAFRGLTAHLLTPALFDGGRVEVVWR